MSIVFTVGILTVSDTVSQGLSVDQSSPALQHLLAKDGGRWSIAATACVPDDMDQIQGTLKLWSSHRKLDMVLTTGGTGFGQRDCTPEAVLPLLTKQAPGLVTAMLMSSIQCNPYAALSRPVCGSRGNTVIITLPGSPKGATENLSAILTILPHAVELSRGATSRAVHEAMVQNTMNNAASSATFGPNANPISSISSTTAALPPSSSPPPSAAPPHPPSSTSSTSSASAVAATTSAPTSPVISPAVGAIAEQGNEGHRQYYPSGGSRTHPHSTFSTVTAAAAASSPMISSIPSVLTQDRSIPSASRPSQDHSSHLPPANPPKFSQTLRTPALRARSSPFPLFAIEDALQVIVSHAKALPAILAEVDDRLVGMALAKSIRARENVPAFRASILDGYAVVASDGPGAYPVGGASIASPSASSKPLESGHIVRITTGAPVPEGADAVVRVEDTRLIKSSPDGRVEDTVEIVRGVTSGSGIREIGSDLRAGETLLSAGDVITEVGGEVGLLASAGVREVPVHRKPVIGILSTGSELVDLHSSTSSTSEGKESREGGTLGHGEVRDANRPALLAAARAAGFPVVDLGISGDNVEELQNVLESALERCDVLVTSGGVSMGEKDLLKAVLERKLGATIHFGRVAIKPGKPTTFATLPLADSIGSRGISGAEGRDRLIFGLAGNPASALVCFHLLVLPALRRLAGLPKADGTVIPVSLGHEVALDPERPEYHRARVESVTMEDGEVRWVAYGTGVQRSSRISSVRGANALLCLPVGGEEHGLNLAKGEVVDAIIIGRL